MKPLYPLSFVALLAMTSCSKMGGLTADNFIVSPSPLESVNGEVEAVINGRFPKKYMKKKAVVTVTPVLKYDGSEAVGKGATFQGEKVVGNAQEIAYLTGGNYTLRTSFPYVMGMAKSDLVLRFAVQKGRKTFDLPEVKVGEGVLASETLFAKTLTSTMPAYAADGYQRLIKGKQEAQINYLIEQAAVRTSELRSLSVQNFVNALRQLRAEEKAYRIENVEVAAYASPDGSTGFNTQLAEKREGSAKRFVDQQLRKEKIKTAVDTRYTAEDWEGFRELVAKSRIEDKEVILRVLSMYKDPEEREQQIKNLAVGFRELATEVLPALRRARLTVNYQVIGRTDEEILTQYAADAAQLSVEELLYAATLTKDVAKQKEIYLRTTQLYPKDYRAYNNLGCLAFAQSGNSADEWTAASRYFIKAAACHPAPEVKANMALIALGDTDDKAAEKYLSEATTVERYQEFAGHLLLSQGKFGSAATALKDVKSNTAALAQILARNYALATTILAALPQDDATTNYLRAILAARQGNKARAATYAERAAAADKDYKIRLQTDQEFR